MRKCRVRPYIDEETWRRFQEYASRRGMSASAEEKEAIEACLQNELGRIKRMDALKALLSVNLGPMGTPEELHEEISRAAWPGGFEDESPE